MTSRTIYLDYNATTPLDEQVLADMLPWMSDCFWNAASAHSLGRIAAKATDSAREALADLVNVRPSELVFTSGATESDNAALKGAYAAAPPNRRRVIVGATEHKAVLDAAKWLTEQGAEVIVASVDRTGIIDEDAFRELLDGSVALVSVMIANNETGVLAPIGRLAEATHEAGAVFHTDATQIVGRLPVDFHELKVDLASFSGHKMYGPKGVGALYVSRRTQLVPLIHGGGQERGFRSGTLNVPGIVGFGSAAELAMKVSPGELEREARLAANLVRRLSDQLPGVEHVSASVPKLPNTACIRFRGADGEAVMANAPEVAISSGSACASMVPAPSHVLLAMGLQHEEVLECLRFSVGRPTDEAEIEEAVQHIVRAVRRVRDLEIDGRLIRTGVQVSGSECA
jgi:cysteine desulfurase